MSRYRARMSPHDWTQQQLDALRDLFAARLSGAQVAEKLTQMFKRPFTRNQTIAKARRLGLPLGEPKRRKKEPVETAAPKPAEAKAPSWTQEQADALRTLSLAGDSDAVIARKLSEMFGRSFTRCQVIGKRLRLGIVREGPLRTTARTARKVPLAKKPSPTFRFGTHDPETRRPINGRLPPILDRKPTLAGEPHTVPLPLMRRKANQCGWPVNDGGPWLFCAQPKAAGDRHYCDYHRTLSLPAPLRARRRA